MTKNKIILAALEEFAEHGYRAATIRNICKRAGVNIAAINYHFSGKAELYRRSMEMVFAFKPPLPDADEIKIDSDIEKVLGAWITAFMSKSNDKKIIENRLMEKIAYHALLNPSEIFDEIFDVYLKPDVISLEKILRKCLPSDTTEKEIKVRIFSILGSCTFYYFHYRIVDKLCTDGDFKEDNLDLIIKHITAQNLIGLNLS